MGREIKFRADPKHVLIFADTDGTVRISFEHQPIRQFTGLRDKNGREVYEGDIIREGGRVAVIQWDSDDARFLYRTETTTAGLYLFNGEVIGNIYEHPHLLREEW